MKINTQKIVVAALVGAFALFLFDGALQTIPGFGVRAVEREESNLLTTEKYDKLTNRMAYIVTDKTVSFVASKPSGFYHLGKFFGLEFLSASLVALFFAVMFARLKGQTMSERLILTLLMGLVASFAIHFPYFNWWGFSAAYTLGVVVKTLLGWLLIAYLQNRFIYQIR